MALSGNFPAQDRVRTNGQDNASCKDTHVARECQALKMWSVGDQPKRDALVDFVAADDVQAIE